MMRVKQQLAPHRSGVNGSGYGNKKLYITIHETANTSRGAGAQMHANLQSRVYKAASWHESIDDKLVVQSFSHNWRCWHAGDGRGNGNLNSIGIEICVNPDSNFNRACDNAAKRTAQLMRAYGIPLSRVVQHNHWSGKNCPARLRSGRYSMNWSGFKQRVSQYYNGKPTAPTKSRNGGKSISQLATEVIQGKHGNGEARKRSLGSRYNAVQREVNRRLSGNKRNSKSISQLATEVIQGKHGNGEARKRSLGSRYNAVQREVNKRLRGK